MCTCFLSGIFKICLVFGMFASVNAATPPPSCNYTHVCHSCYISTLGEPNCVKTLTDVNGTYKFTADECNKQLWSDKSLYGVDYDTNTLRCRGYYCDYGLSYSTSGRTVYRKTCDTACLEATLTSTTSHMIDASETIDAFTDTKSYLLTCFRWACEASSTLCSASFDHGGDLCYKFIGCVPFCLTRANSTWDIVTKICHDAIDCGIPMNVSNGTMTTTGTTYSETAIYTCNTGYIIPAISEPSLSVECTIYGNWSEIAPTCVLVDCGIPDSPVNGSVTYPLGTTFGQNATYSCSGGYELNGTSVVTCMEDTKWSDPAPSCDIIDCGVPDAPSNGIMDISFGTTYGETVTYSCETGFLLSGAASAVCESNGIWNETTPSCNIIDCGGVFPPDNGMVSYTTGSTLYGYTAFYICLGDYILIGDQLRTCSDNGLWNGTSPVCALADCGRLPNPSNGFVYFPSGTADGEVAVYNCSLGYTLVGSSTRTCRLDGTWGGVAPLCEIIDCGSPNLPMNGFISTSSGTTFGSKVTVECYSGFRLSSNDSQECLATGNWSDPPPVCNEIPTTTTPIQTTTPLPILHYILPCACVTNKTFTNLTTDEILSQLIEDTKITFNTTVFTNRLGSRQDPRWSSSLIGYASMAFVGLVFGFLLVLDVHTMNQQGFVCAGS